MAGLSDSGQSEEHGGTALGLHPEDAVTPINVARSRYCGSPRCLPAGPRDRAVRGLILLLLSSSSV
jgi:hypothetical protein